MPKRALITGISGQDGSYLSELLLGKGYEVHGLVRRSSAFDTGKLKPSYPDGPRENGIHYVFGDLTNANSLTAALRQVRPDEVYNLAAQSNVHASFEMPEYTAEVTGLGALRLLEAIRETGLKPRIFQASSSEIFGDAVETPQRETTPFRPRTPYAAAKLYAYWTTVNYRDNYGMFACNGILFNHESPRRGDTFVTRKISRGAAAIKLGLQDKLYLGNLDARRDWGFAGDFVQAMWLMLQQDHPGDYVIATGEAHSVRDFLDEAFSYLGLDWKPHVEVDPRNLRPAEVESMRGDSTLARTKLGWQPQVSFSKLVRMMVDADLDRLKRVYAM